MSVFTLKTETGHEVPAHFAGGEWRMLATTPSPLETKGVFSAFASENPVIPRSEWRAASRTRASVPILNQGQRGSCTGHGAATAMMLARDISGAGFQLLSAPFLYAQINHGVDNGSSAGDAANVLLNTGICLMAEFPEPNYLARDIPQVCYQTAQRFKATEIYRCTTFDEMVTAWMLGFSTFDTVRVGTNFNYLDQYGVPPASQGIANHCTAGGDSLKQLPSGEWVLEHRNSWTTAWGVNGCYYMSEAHVLGQGQWYECYAIKSTTEDPQDPLTPPR